MSIDLEARLIFHPKDAKKREEINAYGTIVNVGNETLTFNPVPLNAPSLALEIVDTEGSPLNLPPPPVPGGKVRAIDLEPGQSYKMEYRGFVPQWTAPNTYKARLLYTHQPSSVAPGEWAGKVSSKWVEFKILP